MTYQEEEQSRLRRQNSREAIALALKGQWREAIAVNKSIIEIFANDVEALNRLGRAYMELGEYAEAEASYRRTLEIDSYNAIAQKNLQRLALLKKSKSSQQTVPQKLEPQVFIEEIGKAGVVQLINLARPNVLAQVVAGDVVNLKVDGNNLVVETPQHKFLGHVEAKHGQRLIRLIKGGNKYSAAIVSSTDRSVSVIIRETFQHPNQAGQLSFPTRGAEGGRTDISDRVIRREIEQEESFLGEPGYTVVGGEDSEIPLEEPVENDFDDDTES
jgi:Tetratricopeptide repeat